MQGHLHLTVAHDPSSGHSYLARQSFRAPMHLGKGYQQDDALLVHAVNSTAGLFAGDAVDWNVQVDAGASLRLVSPSATRVHRAARHDRPASSLEPARQDQAFRVAPGARLEVWPELFIPHAGCRYRQTTRIDVAAGGALIFCESLAPGRVASGEAFAWESLRWATDLRYAGEPVVRERWHLRAGEANGWRDALGLAAPCYATIFVVSARPDDEADRWAQIHDLQGRDLRIGVSRLRVAGWTIKILAADGAVLRATLGRVRALLSSATVPAGRG